jgi:hypothetical protein
MLQMRPCQESCAPSELKEKNALNPFLPKIKTISAADRQAIAIAMNGDMYSWGQNDNAPPLICPIIISSNKKSICSKRQEGDNRNLFIHGDHYG